MSETLEPALPDELIEAAQRLMRATCDRELKLVTAESCTGGLLASLLTDIEGCAHGFDRGFVCYSDEAKSQQLGISPELIDGEGAVSEAVARSMAEQALHRSQGHVALSTTGFAGPAGPDEEEGLVHLALARRDTPTIHRVEHFGSIGRGPVRIETLRVALRMLEGSVTGRVERETSDG